jgi:homoserine O-acetyltransferase
LNTAGDNAILICHYFSGDSHAAGKYAADEKIPGYWDPIIGPGKAIDTDKYFVISSDTLCNLNTKNPRVVTTGPASIDPKTGKPYGMSFPLVTIRDFVNVQYALVKSLGVKKLAVVTGASMGGLQTFEWAAAYPDFVERAVPVISTPKVHAWLVGWLNLWGMPVTADPKWNGGDYYGKEEPFQGLVNALKLVTLSALWADWADQGFDRKWADAQKNPQEAMPNQFLVEKVLTDRATDRAKLADANSMLYLIKASALYDLGQAYGSMEDAFKRIKAKVLMIGADTDILFVPSGIKSYLEPMSKAGLNVTFHEIKTGKGHLGGVLDIGQAQEVIAKFLAQ